MQVSPAVVEVERAVLSEAHLATVSLSLLPEHGVRLRIDSFAVTANNVTYAQVADQLGYWSLFPAGAGRGIIPVWGHATVVQSRCAEVAVGERLYGLLPMATHFDVVAGEVTSHALTDTAPHRASMSPFYNRYGRLGSGPSPDLLRDRVRETFQPLFATGYLIEQVLRDAQWHGADQLVVTSASSKTALALAFQAGQSSPTVRRLGLTSARNLDYVRGTGLFDAVVAYDEIGKVERRSTVLVDFAGSPVIRRAVHTRLDDSLRLCCSVGVTHAGVSAAASADPLPGPVPQFFFAPAELERAAARLGADVFQRELGAAFRVFAAAAVDLVVFDERPGLAAARAAYLTTLAGEVSPAEAIIIMPDRVSDGPTAASLFAVERRWP